MQPAPGFRVSPKGRGPRRLLVNNNELTSQSSWIEPCRRSTALRWSVFDQTKMHGFGHVSLYETEKPISGLPEIGAHLLSFILPSKPICGGLSTDFLLALRSGLSPPAARPLPTTGYRALSGNVDVEQRGYDEAGGNDPHGDEGQREAMGRRR